ncbi:MAG: phosphoenolpyruvate--protein phosphotransferase [Gemmataceae bacterium]
MKKGVPVSPGVAVARAHCVDEVITSHEPYSLDDSGLSAEVSRFERACAAVIRELDDTIARVTKQIGDDEAAIFRAHRQLLRDPTLLNKVMGRICGKKLDAASSLRETLEEYAALFRQIPDAYLQERLADLRDVTGRVVVQLSRDEQQQSKIDFSEPVILVAPEIFPSQAALIDKRWIAGIITEAGAATGHAAILARALGIPAVSGIRGILREVRGGDLLALDGREGHVYVNPGPEVESAYRKLAREFADFSHRLIENHDLEAVSPDGVPVELLANVSGVADAHVAGHAGATGVGLYRTEYLFLTHASVPDEEEQFAAYREVIEAAPNKTVTIRTLDLGGDKHVSYLGTRKEANPFMGFRSIRLTTAYPEFFQAQLRAILRAARHGRVSLMFPMISQLEEVQRIKRVVHRTKVALKRAGIPFAEDVPVGIMIEVPAAALCIEELLDEVDFVSIGSNDLIQYLMAADRDNPQVAHLCEPFSPALLRLLARVIGACGERNKPVTLCGEMAGWPRCFLPLFGMGLRRLSMSPAAVPTLKELVRRTHLSLAEEVTRRVLTMPTTGEIRGYLTRKVQEVWPNVTLVDMRR